MKTLLAQLEQHSTCVIIGAGGVGKTSIAAALGLAFAEQGNNTCVLTIDPARRLASALGLRSTGNEILEVPGLPETFHITMLDAKATFDAMIMRYCGDEEQAKSLISNTVYQNLVTRLSGTQEYMAFERLWELIETGHYDRVIVDTPPAQAAIDFLHAPTRLASFLDNKIFRFLVRPAPFYLRPLAIATRTLIRQISQVVGAQVVDETIEFFQSFSEIEAGFRERAHATSKLLESEDTAYLLVSAPKPDAIATAIKLEQLLREVNREIDSIVINRMAPDYSNLPRSRTSGGAELVEELVALRKAQIDVCKPLLGSAPTIFIDDMGMDVSGPKSLSKLSQNISESEVAIS